MTNTDAELAAFQAVLLDILYQYETAEEIIEALGRSQACQPFSEWINQMNPALLETGAELVKKWAVKFTEAKTESLDPFFEC